MIGSFRAMNSLLFFAGFEVVAARSTASPARKLARLCRDNYRCKLVQQGRITKDAKETDKFRKLK
jgi:hypothetical protein